MSRIICVQLVRIRSQNHCEKISNSWKDTCGTIENMSSGFVYMLSAGNQLSSGVGHVTLDDQISHMKATRKASQPTIFEMRYRMHTNNFAANKSTMNSSMPSQTVNIDSVNNSLIIWCLLYIGIQSNTFMTNSSWI